MKQFLTLCIVCITSLFVVGCSDTNSCYDLKCAANDAACKQPMPKTDYTLKDGTTKKLGVISYIVTVIQDKVEVSSELIFKQIIKDSSFKKVVTACMMLFVAMYGIAIALGLAQPSPLDLVIRIAKMAVIYYLLTSWGNFQGIVADFFNKLTSELSTIFTTAIVSSASGQAGATVDAMDVFNFVDDKVLGTLLSVRFAVIIGAMLSISGVGLIVGLLLFGVVLSYLWTLIMSVQIYIMAGIARALLYAVSPIFIIFLLFNQTKPLFEGWLKQLVNFSLQPILLVGFMAFFNGVFFNYMDVMFKPDYEICYKATPTTGQVVRLSGFVLIKNGKAWDPKNPIQITEAMDMFTLFVIIMLGTIMVKMNQWAVQAASQLSEGGITFTNTMAANSQMANNITQGAGGLMRDAVGLKGKGAK